MKEKSHYQGRRAIIKYSPEEVSSFMKIIKYEFNNFFNLNYPDKKTKDLNENNHYSKEKENSKFYYFKYSKYILCKFNSTIVNMMTLYINQNSSFPDNYKIEQDFEYNMIKLLKHLMLNEIEVAYFTLLIDQLGWKHDKIDHWIYFSILGIITKNTCTKDNDSILLMTLFSRKYPRFHDLYSNFIINEKIISLMEEKPITIYMINKRFIQLSKPINTYCRKNYINIDGIVDKIVNSSHPYFKDVSAKSKIKDNNNKINQYEKLLYIINNQSNNINFEFIKNIGDNMFNNTDIEDNIFLNQNGSYGSLRFEEN